MATLAGFIAIFMWGMLAALSVFTNRIPPFQLLFICFSIAASLVYFKRLISREPLLKMPSMNVNQWAVGVVGLFGFHILYFLALRFAPPIQATLIIYLWPLMLGVMVASKGNKRFAILGGVIGFAGTIVMIAGGLETAQTNSEQALVGYLCAAACAVIWANYSWFLSKSASDVEDISWVALVVAIISLACHLIFESGVWDLTTTELVMVILIGIGPTGGAFYLWDIGMKKGNQSWIASFSFGTPVIASLALFLFGFSDLTLSIVIAASLIVLGAVVSNSLSKKQELG
ncbi:DMT family transporter [Psychrosphaera aestuarii]|uniref:DMT family transporter n=1 Tax=Psychrosphaera aestuarii TaxID=1266052 RepID=UPI001B332E1D|nr:DMT family transporter [Psychrosphaera aestuarii]